MKGTAILYQKDLSVTIIEDIDRSVFEEIKEQSGDDNCSCMVEDKIVDLGSVSPVYWHEDEVDWDYGY